MEVGAHAVHKARERADLRGREKRGEEGEGGLAGGTHKRMVPLKRRKRGTYIARDRERRHGHEDSQGIYSAGAGIESDDMGTKTHMIYTKVPPSWHVWHPMSLGLQ